jgi:hypothetical protein
MPLHDWSGAPAGLYHVFHELWAVTLMTTLNDGRLPDGFTAIIAQKTGPKEGDVIAVDQRVLLGTPPGAAGGVATKDRPKTRIVSRSDGRRYAAKANRVVVQHHLGQTVAVIEIVSPGNKDSERAFTLFVSKVGDYIERGVHVLVVDILPPTPRDPAGVHKAIWDQFLEEPFAFPAGEDRVIAAYRADTDPEAFVETMGVGHGVPTMPLFLVEELNVRVPLEAAYMQAWDLTPRPIREGVLTGQWPRPLAGP